MKPLLFSLGLTLALIAGSALAAENIEAKAKPLSATGTVEISNIRGTISVTGWDRNMVAVTGSLGAGTRLVFESSGNRMVVRAERSNESTGWFGVRGSGPKEDTRLQVHVPKRAALELESVSADIEVSGIAESDRIKVESVSGDVQIQASVADLVASSVSGDLNFQGRVQRARADTVSGDFRLRDVQETLNIETVSGDARIVDSSLAQIDAGSVSGDLEFDVELLGNARVAIETMSGEVTLILPSGLNASVNAESFSGSLRSDFQLDISDQKGPGSTMRGKLGSGDARIRMESFSGDIRLRKH